MSYIFNRRQFFKNYDFTLLSGVFFKSISDAEESICMIYQRLVPSRKDLDAEWAISLTKRGARLDAALRTSDKSHMLNIGMTVGGIGCGTVHLSGDGRLYVLDIFIQPHAGVVANLASVPPGMKNIGNAGIYVCEQDGSNYIKPPTADNQPNPFKQGFSLAIDGDPKVRPLDLTGWESLVFDWRWPVASVEYADTACPLRAKLEAWTPFIPLATDDSSLPVTVMEYTLENHGDRPVGGSLTGHWENPVLIHTRRHLKAEIASVMLPKNGRSILFHHAVLRSSQGNPAREDIVFDDFERQVFAPWESGGDAFGTGPIDAAAVPAYQGDLAPHGGRWLNSHAGAPGKRMDSKDDAIGKLIAQHIVESAAPTFAAGDWITMEIEVRGHEEIIHRINGTEVLRHQHPQLDPECNLAPVKDMLGAGVARMVSSGHIALQAEGQPIWFRKIELKSLELT